MIYMMVEHIEDDDVDLFSFPNLDIAVKYIQTEGISDYTLSDREFEEYPIDDYTYIEN